MMKTPGQLLYEALDGGAWFKLSLNDREAYEKRAAVFLKNVSTEKQTDEQTDDTSGVFQGELS